VEFLRSLLDYIEARSQKCASSAVVLVVGCSRFSADEAHCRLESNVVRRAVRRPLGPSPAPLDAIRIVMSGARQITAFLCPNQLPNGARSQTATPNDTLECSGGSVPIGQPFTFNVRTLASLGSGQVGEFFARQAGGTFQGPVAITLP
jgi:hypothetical protein